MEKQKFLENCWRGLFSWWNQNNIFAPVNHFVAPESITTAQIHVKLILNPVILAKVLHQPILDPIGFWIIKI